MYSLVDKLSDRFSEWSNITNEYIKLHYTLSDSEDIQQKFENSVLKMHKILEELLLNFIKFGRFKDKFSSVQMSVFPDFGQVAVVFSQKLQTEFEFGINNEGFFMSTYVTNPECLIKVKDDFWIELTSLFSLGVFKFTENACITPLTEEEKSAEKIFQKAKSNVFKIVSDYILLSLNNPDSLIDFGWFEIKWPFNQTDWEHLIVNGCQAFKKLYRLNYLLYKAGKRKKQHAK